MHVKPLYYRAGTLILLTMAAGCGSKLVKVKGQLMLDGKPVEGASISFQPVENTGPQAQAMTDEDGNFRLSTFAEGDGAMPGEYKVIILPPGRRAPPQEERQLNSKKEFFDYLENLKEQAKKEPLPFGGDISNEYRDPTRTPLRQHVPSDGLVRIDLPATAATGAAKKIPNAPRRVPRLPSGVSPAMLQ
jgi:hypothetical protein